MLDNPDVLDTVGPDLDEARAKIEAARDALEALLDTEVEEAVPIRQLVARLDQIAKDVRKAEESVSSSVGVTGVRG
jgi:hypothetical protein